MNPKLKNIIRFRHKGFFRLSVYVILEFVELGWLTNFVALWHYLLMGFFFCFFFYPFSNFYFSKAPAEKSILHQAFPQRVSTELFSSVPFSEWASRWRLCTVQEKKKRNVAEIGSTFIFTQWIDPESWLVHKMPVKFCIYNLLLDGAAAVVHVDILDLWVYGYK